ncbi:MAG: TIGR01777 family oxidoreductase [Acidobacteriota bacterium]|nr:TIGR01777 family oxidoreductase [Acidobacteriota bacterium]
MKILMTGATGFIGKVLSKALADDGHQLVVLSRRPETAEVVPGAKAFRWNSEAEAPPAECWTGVEAVIHLAGEPVAAKRWTDEQKRRIRDSRVVGTRNLVKGMKAAAVPPKVFISSSAVGFYGNRGDEQVDERSAPGTGFFPDICTAWEYEAEQAKELGTRVVLVRIGVVLGDGGMLEKILLPFKLGVGGILGSGRQWFPWIHIDDMVGILRHALYGEHISGAINGVAPNPATNAEFTKALGSALHRPTIFPVPELALRVLMGEMANAALDSQRVNPTATLESGYKFRYPQLQPALDSLMR